MANKDLASSYGSQVRQSFVSQPAVLGSEHALSSTSDLPETFGALDEQVIILGREDIRADAPPAPLLDWSTFEKGIAVQLKDTEGLDVGSVIIKASTLQRIHPALLPVPLESEYLFPISLKTVVLQVQAHLRQGLRRESTIQLVPILTPRSRRSPVKMKAFSNWQKYGSNGAAGRRDGSG